MEKQLPIASTDKQLAIDKVMFVQRDCSKERDRRSEWKTSAESDSAERESVLYERDHNERGLSSVNDFVANDRYNGLRIDW